jgi:hypothetical protein
MRSSLSASQARVGRPFRRLRLEGLEARETPAAFTPGNLVIYRVGVVGAPSAPSNTGAAVFLDEYSPTGALVQSIAMPTTASGGQFQLIGHGTATAEGYLTRSADRGNLVLLGYGRDLGGTGAVSSTTSAAVPRVVGVVGANGSVDTSTALSDFASAGNARTVASTNGTDLWVASSNDGIKYATRGATTSTAISDLAPTRHLNIFDGQLYIGASSGTFRIGTVGTGLPTTGPQTTTNLPGFTTTGSPYGYFFADLDAGVPGVDTLYYCDDSNTAGVGGVWKYNLVGGNWVSRGMVGAHGDAYRGLTGVVSGSSVTLFGTKKTSELFTLTDTTGYNGTLTATPTVIATAATNTLFRGIAPTPIAYNQAPVNSLPTSPAALEDVPISVTGVSVADPDAGTTNIKVTLSVPTGTLTVADTVTNGLVAGQITGNGTGTVVITAPQAAINTTFADATGLTFKTAANAAASVVLTMTTDDLGNTGAGTAKTDTDNVTIAVTAVNDAPTLNAVGDVTINEDAPQQTVALAGIGPGGAADEATQTLTVTATSSDPAIVPNPTVTSTGATTADLKFTPDANAYGTVTITVKVNDGGGTANGGVEELLRTFTVTINPINDAPTLTVVGDVTLNEDAGEQTIDLAGISAGPNEDDQVITITAVSNNTDLIPNPTVTYTSPNATGTLQFTPVANLFGTATITVTVTDNGGTVGGGINTVVRTINVTVNPVNDAPTFDALPNLTIDENAGEQTVDLTGISAGPIEPTQFIHFGVTSDNPGLIPNPTTQYTSPNATGTLKFTPVAGQAGTATITVTLMDDGGTANGGIDTIVRSFTVTVAPPNQPPTLDAIGNQTVNEDAPEQTVNLSGISAGHTTETGQTISIAATSDNPSLIPNPTVQYTSPDATGTLKFTPAANQSGTATITVTVTDNGGTANGGVDTFVRTFTITVDPVNDAPTLDPISNVTVFEDAPEQTVNLSGIAAGQTNEAGQALSVVAVSSNPSLVPNPTVTYTSPDATGTLAFTPAANQTGTATITVTVTDNGGTANGGVNAFQRTFTVTIDPVNDGPTLNQPANVVLNEDAAEQTVTLTGITAGPANENGQGLAVTAVSDNTGLIPNPAVTYTSPGSAGTLKFTPVANASGTATITVTVTDDAGTANGGVNSFVQMFTVTVNPVNDIPVVSGGPFAILQSVPNGSTVGTVTAADVENNTPFTFAITGGNTGGAFSIDPTGGEITVANAAAIADFFLLTVTATDSGGAVGTGTVQVAIDRVPTTSGIPNQSKPEDFGPFDVDLAAAFSDFETADPDLSYAVVANSNPALFSAVTVAGTTLTLTPAPDSNGVATLTVRATDEQGQSVETSFQVTIGPVNDGPVLNAAAKVALSAVAAKATNPAGDLVTRLTANVTDVDVETPGVAVTGFTQGANGVWQFSTDNGANWQPIPTDVAADGALLLSETAKVRFLPAKKFQGFAFLSYKAWDQTAGTATTQVDTTTGSAFSAAVETAVVAVGKTSPRIDAAGFPLLSNVAEGTAAPKGDAISTLVGTLATDANAKTKFGIAVTGLTGAANGTWQYSVGGNKWFPVGTVGDTAALLLGPKHKLRFVPNGDYSGQATVTYRAWDQSAGTAGSKAAVAGSAFSAAAETAVVNVTPVNDAPVLNTTIARTLPAVAGGATAGPVTVNSLIAGAVTDVDGTPAGVVVIGATGAGRWQYRSGAGAFTDIPKVSTSKGFLLAATDEVQFVAAAGFTGSAALSYKAWDGSTGTAEQTVSTKGTAFSVGTELLTVAAVGNVATDVTGGTAALPAVAEDTTSPAGTSVANVLKSVLPKGLKGIAITNATGTNGKWQYALTRNAWVDIGAATEANAVLLSAATQLRFVPNANFNGTATFDYRAWDMTTGQSGDRFDTTQAGLVSFGATTATASVQVTPLNDSPVLDTAPAKILAPLTGTETTPMTVASLLGTAATDADGTSDIGIAVTAAGGPGTWSFSTDGTNFNPFPTVSASKPLFLVPTALVKFGATGTGGASLSYKAWDQSTDAGAGAASTATETLTFAVGATTPPTIGAGPTLTPIAEDATAIAGDVVGTAFGTGIAVTGLTGAAGGSWQYSLVKNIWADVGTVSDTAALVLPTTASLRFLPSANFNGSATVTAKGWDGFSGAAGDKVDTTAAALANSFSTATATGTVTVAAANDAPVLDTTPAPALPDLPVNPTTNAGVTVESLLGGAATDVDGATLGIALVGAAGKGTWQFSTDGTNWTTVKPSTSKAVLLDATALVRFVPAAGFVGTATLSYRAWEVTAGQIGTTAAVKGSAFSVATETATVSVGNAGPVLNSL